MVNQLENRLKKSDIRNCKWCNVKYDYAKRELKVKAQEIEKRLSVKSHAQEYCTNLCWIESDKAGCC